MLKDLSTISSPSSVIPVLPRDFEDRTREMTEEDRVKLRRQLQAEFVKAKAQWSNWVRQDRNPLMNKTAKLIATFLIESLNFETGRCFPSHETIADHVGISERQVRRTVKRVQEAGWVKAHRLRRNQPTFYSFHAPHEAVKRIEEGAAALKASREARREDRRYPRLINYEPSIEQLAAFRASITDRTFLTARPSPDRTFMAATDRTFLTGEYKNVTPEEFSGSEVEEYTQHAPVRAASLTNSYARAKGGM